MVRILALLILAWPLLAAPVPKPAQTPSVVGTTWEGRNVWSQGQTEGLKLTFQDGGKLIYDNGSLSVDNYRGTWEQTGETVEWKVNDHAVFKGTISGTKIEGSGHNNDKNKVTFTFTRLEAK